MLLVFEAALPKDVTTALRKVGFRYRRVMQHWEGLARFDDVSALAEGHGGIARRVSAAGGPPGETRIAETAK